jgi:chorismate mutase
VAAFFHLLNHIRVHSLDSRAKSVFWMNVLPAALLLVPLILSGCAGTTPLPEESEPVVAVMAERLKLARDVAWAKWADGLPVRDPAREAAVLDKLTRQGEAAGIDEPLVSRFVRAQIEASCLEQEAWMAKWRKGNPLPEGPPPALESLRTQIDRLSSLLLAEWAAAPTTPRAAARQRLLKSVVNPRSAAVAASGFFDAAR